MENSERQQARGGHCNLYTGKDHPQNGFKCWKHSLVYEFPSSKHKNVWTKGHTYFFPNSVKCKIEQFFQKETFILLRASLVGKLLCIYAFKH